MTNDKGLVIYMGPYSFPDGGAAARRIYGNCLSLKSAGYKVIVASGQISAETPSEYNGIKIVSYNERLYERLPNIIKHLLYFSAGKKAVQWLDQSALNPVAIIIYSGYSPYLLRLLAWSRGRNVKIIFDAVEWYDPPGLLAKCISPYFLNIEFAMRFLIKRCDGVIAISKHLYDYYTKFGVRAIKVPPTISCRDTLFRIESNESECVNIVYAGSPGIKDLLSVIVEAVLLIAESGAKIRLHIAGVSDSQLLLYMPGYGSCRDLLNDSIICYGVLSHSAAMELVKEADYSLIIRPNIRSVQAGFPTKFVESMAVGTPVIANITSDLGIYLKDGFNGFVCDGYMVSQVFESIQRAINSKSDLKIRRNARETAERYFDISEHAASLTNLIDI